MQLWRPLNERLARVARKTAAPAKGQDWVIPDLAGCLIWLAPGTFKMGSEKGELDEKPVHAVRISRGFWLGKCQVRQSEFEMIMGANPSSWKGADLPVEGVSWYDAVDFCRKLTARERRAGRLLSGYVYRLPTEAEWEYACRAGGTGASLDSLDDTDWYAANSDGRTHEVGLKKPNAWGLHDMYGNVWEWCFDWYDKDFYARSRMTNPVNLKASSRRVFRGGGWYSSAKGVRAASRGGFVPSNASDCLGFRFCLAPKSAGQWLPGWGSSLL